MQCLRPWLRKGVAEYAKRSIEDGLSEEDNQQLKAGTVQIRKFLTFRSGRNSGEGDRDPVWALVNDKTHCVVVRFDPLAVDHYERGHSVSFTSCTGAIISLKPFCTRPTMRINPVGGGKNLEIVLECSGFSVVGSVGESNFAQDAVPIHQLYRPKTFPTAPLVQQEERKKQKQQEEETPFIEAWVKAEMGRQLPPPNVIAIQAAPVRHPCTEAEVTSSLINISGMPPPAQPLSLRQKRSASPTSDSETEDEEFTHLVAGAGKKVARVAFASPKEDQHRRKIAKVTTQACAAAQVQDWENFMTENEWEDLPDLGPLSDNDTVIQETQAPPPPQVQAPPQDTSLLNPVSTLSSTSRVLAPDSSMASSPKSAATLLSQRFASAVETPVPPPLTVEQAPVLQLPRELRSGAETAPLPRRESQVDAANVSAIEQINGTTAVSISTSTPFEKVPILQTEPQRGSVASASSEQKPVATQPESDVEAEDISEEQDKEDEESEDQEEEDKGDEAEDGEASEEENVFELPGPGIGGEVRCSEVLRRHLAGDQRLEDEEDSQETQEPALIRGGADLLCFGSLSQEEEEDAAAVEADLSGMPPKEASSSNKSTKESADWTASDEVMSALAGSGSSQPSGRGEGEKETSQVDPFIQQTAAPLSPPRSSEPPGALRRPTTRASPDESRTEIEQTNTAIAPPAKRRPASRPSNKPVKKKMEAFSLSSPDGSSQQSQRPRSDLGDDVPEAESDGDDEIASCSPTEDALSRQKKSVPVLKNQGLEPRPSEVPRTHDRPASRSTPREMLPLAIEKPLVPSSSTPRALPPSFTKKQDSSPSSTTAAASGATCKIRSSTSKETSGKKISLGLSKLIAKPAVNPKKQREFRAQPDEDLMQELKAALSAKAAKKQRKPAKGSSKS